MIVTLDYGASLQYRALLALRERLGCGDQVGACRRKTNFLIDEFEKLLGPRTKLVAITQMSNALGTVVR